MRLASFNILFGRPVLGRQRDQSPRAQLLEAVDILDPTILAIQEVDVAQPRSGGLHQPAAIAEHLGAVDWRFAPTIVGTPGNRRTFRPATPAETARDDRTGDSTPRYGIALVSRVPVVRWAMLRLGASSMGLPLLVQDDVGPPRLIRIPDEPRVAIAAVIATRRGLVTVVATHLSFVPGFNLRQLATIRRWLSMFPRPAFVLGDLNIPSHLPGPIARLRPLLTAPTFPSYRPRIQFDHLLAGGLSRDDLALARRTARVHALPVSDHCAVSVQVPYSP